MNWKTILVLLAVLIGLGYYLFRESSRSKTAPDKVKTNLVLSFEMNQVVGMDVGFPDTVVMIKKRENGWVTAYPFDGIPADSITINQLLNVLHRISFRQTISIDSINLAEVRLDRPVLSFTLHFADGDTSKLVFGILNPDTENIYARKDRDNRVVLIDRAFGPLLGVNIFMLRGKGLIALRPYDVARIKYSSPGESRLTVEKNQDTGEWWIEDSGKRILADARMVMDLLWALSADQVREFYPARTVNVKETGLSNSRRVLWIGDEKGDTNAVFLGNPESERDYLCWAKSSIYPESLVLVDSSLVSLIDNFRTGNLKSLRINNFRPAEVDRIELTSPMDTIVISAENDTLWQIVRPEKIRCRLWQVERLLAHADTMGARQILTPASTGRGFDHPQLKLVLSGGEKVLARVLVGDFAESKSIYVRDDLRNIDFLAPANQFERLNLTFKDLADIPVRHVVQ